MPLAASPPAGWNLALGPAIFVVGLTALYVVRFARVRREGGRNAQRGAPWWRAVLFALGVLALVAALFSPVDALGESLFVMHMTQHVLLLDVAPILIILALTKVLLRPATRRLQALEEAAGPLAHPVFAVVLYCAVMWLWHVPALYDAAVESDAIHVLEHASMSAAGALYWWHLLGPIRPRRGMEGMQPVLYMVATKLVVGALGVALAFSPDALYAVYEDAPPGGYWGLSPTTDQHLGGLVMALEQSIVMGIALIWLFARALSESERAAQRAERYEESPA